jgi:hypothetical protein
MSENKPESKAEQPKPASPKEEDPQPSPPKKAPPPKTKPDPNNPLYSLTDGDIDSIKALDQSSTLVNEVLKICGFMLFPAVAKKAVEKPPSNGPSYAAKLGQKLLADGKFLKAFQRYDNKKMDAGVYEALQLTFTDHPDLTQESIKSVSEPTVYLLKFILQQMEKYSKRIAVQENAE